MIIELQEWGSVGGLRLAAETVHALARTEAFTVSPDPTSSGRWRVSAQRYVGLLAVGDVQFRIVPKVPVHRLMELIFEAAELADWRPEDVLWAASDDLLPAIAASFATHAERALRLGLIQGYRRAEEDLYSVRGRVDFGRQSGRPREFPLPVAVTFDDYTTNVMENQLLAGATKVLLQFNSLPAQLITRLRRLEYRLLDVLPARPSRNPPLVIWSRLNDRYKTAVSLSRLVLRGAAIEVEGARQTIGTSFLVNMDRLFEAVVGRGVQRALATRGFRVELQHRDHFDFDGHMEIRPDILVFRNGRPVAVADLKYKLEISNHDVYQVLAYARRYGLDDASLIVAGRPEMRSLSFPFSDVHLHSVDLDRPQQDREALFAQIAGLLIGPLVPP